MIGRRSAILWGQSFCVGDVARFRCGKSVEPRLRFGCYRRLTGCAFTMTGERDEYIIPDECENGVSWLRRSEKDPARSNSGRAPFHPLEL